MNLTKIICTHPFGLFARSGHRLLCADGKVRAAELAQTADTWFSIPAQVRVKSQSVSGYATTEENSDGSVMVNTFRHHDAHAGLLPKWPDRFTPEHDALIALAVGPKGGAK